MTKPKTCRLSCTASVQLSEYVEYLLWSGLWGSTRSAVIERLLSHAIRDVVDPVTFEAFEQAMREEREQIVPAAEVMQ